MKHLIILIALVISSFAVYSQDDSTKVNQSVTFTMEEVDNINGYILELEDSVKLQTAVIEAQDQLIMDLENQVVADSVSKSFVIMELDAIRRVSDINYNLYETTKPKWHEKRWVGFIGGALTILGTSIIVKNTMQIGN